MRLTCRKNLTVKWVPRISESRGSAVRKRVLTLNDDGKWVTTKRAHGQPGDSVVAPLTSTLRPADVSVWKKARVST